MTGALKLYRVTHHANWDVAEYGPRTDSVAAATPADARLVILANFKHGVIDSVRQARGVHTRVWVASDEDMGT